VREQDDPRQHQAGTERPDEIAFCGRQHRRGGRQRADMDGMAGRKGIEPFARERYAVKMTANGQAVGPLLIEHGLQHVGNDSHRNGGEQKVVAVAAMARGSVAAIDPTVRGERAQQMFVRAPGQDFGGFFCFRAGMCRNRIRDFNVGPGRRTR
jgi:hypothetical protein